MRESEIAQNLFSTHTLALQVLALLTHAAHSQNKTTKKREAEASPILARILAAASSSPPICPQRRPPEEMREPGRGARAADALSGLTLQGASGSPAAWAGAGVVGEESARAHLARRCPC